MGGLGGPPGGGMGGPPPMGGGMGAPPPMGDPMGGGAPPPGGGGMEQTPISIKEPDVWTTLDALLNHKKVPVAKQQPTPQELGASAGGGAPGGMPPMGGMGAPPGGDPMGGGMGAPPMGPPGAPPM